MTIVRGLCLITGLLLGIASLMVSGHATSGDDCLSRIPTPGGFPTQGGTTTVHPGIRTDCVMHLPGGAVLRASGATAPPSQGRAIFRVSGSGPDSPGGVTIVASASITNTPSAPELLPQLNADAVILLPRNAVLVHLDIATGRFVPVPNAHIRLAGLYKILRRGTPPVAAPTPSSMPTTLPATGGSPFSTLLAAAGVLAIAGSWLGCGVLRVGSRCAGTVRRTPITERLCVILCASGLLLAGATGLVYAYVATRPVPVGFGTFADRGGPTPRNDGASSPPTRLVIARLGIDTPVVSLGVVGGAWQVPAYAAGYLAGGAWPGHSGNEVIAGHDDRDGAAFRRLGELRPGDTVRVYAGRHVYRYAVTALRVVPAAQVDVLRSTRSATLTLITCFPYLIDTERLVVRARLLP